MLGRLVAPLRLGGTELLPTLVKLGSCIGVDNMRRCAPLLRKRLHRSGSGACDDAQQGNGDPLRMLQVFPGKAVETVTARGIC